MDDISGDENDLFTSLYKICEDVIGGTQQPAVAYEEVAAFALEKEATCSILVDVLVAVEGDLELAEDKDDAKKRFLQFLELLSNTVIPDDVLRLELECLDAAKGENRTQLVRTKTRLYFKQTKFNLLREESEGYSKLIAELLEVEGADDTEMANVVKTRIFSLIGQFNLDPSRVTDIVLECFENRPKKKKFFIALLKEIDMVREYLCAILGFKFVNCQKPGRQTPYSLYVVTAALIQHEMIDTLKILAYMVPKTEEIKESHRARASNGQNRASKAETISTASIPIESSAARNLDDATSSSTPNAQIQGVSFATVAAIQEADDLKLANGFTEELALATNQKLGVACALLEAGSWLYAQPLLDRLPEYYAVQASPRLCRAMCQLIEESIDEFYTDSCSRKIFDVGDSSTQNDDIRSSQGLKKVTNWAELAELSNVLWYLGPRIAYSATATVKLLRLVTAFYQKGDEEADRSISRVLMDMVEECLLPSLTLSETNVALSEELWVLLQLFPYAWRYRLYGRWAQQSLRHPEVNIARGKVLGRTRYVLKRLSKETVKVMGRQLGKLCHIHPMTVLDYLLSSVQTFDNLIGPVVDGLKFLTNLEFDVLTYCIISQLANPAKQQLKASDGTLSPWLQALGTMVGAVYKRYTLELGGMLEYVTNQLKCCKSFDLLILREIIQNMSWVESSSGATQEQLEALSGGDILRQEAGGYTNVKNKRASQRLREALLNGDLAVGLCILIAQQKEHVVFEDSKSPELPLKLICEMVDQCNDTLQQLGAFLSSFVKTDDYAKRMPPPGKLLAEYFLRFDVAMFLTRPTFISKVIESYELSKKQMRANDPDGQKSKLDSTIKEILFNTALDVKINEIIEEIEPVLSSQLGKDMPPKLIAIFWMLSLYDIEVPSAAYERTIENTRKQCREAGDNFELSRAKRVKEEERLKALETKLREEHRRQTDHVNRVRSWLSASRYTLFDEKTKSQINGFLQMCVLPRALFSEVDAVYCARFVILLHQQKTTFFQSLVTVDRTFNDILPLISGLTEMEANSLGRFLELILTHVQRWHADKDVYEKECNDFPGFVASQKITYDSFRKLCLKWQTRLTKTFTTVLSKPDGEYVLIRNCLIFMTKMAPCFPLLTTMVKSLEKVATAVRDREKGKRDDLSLKAASYIGRLKMRGVRVYELHEFAIVKSTKSAASKSQGNPVEATTTSTNSKNVAPTTAKPKATEEGDAEKRKPSKAVSNGVALTATTALAAPPTTSKATTTPKATTASTTTTNDPKAAVAGKPSKTKFATSKRRDAAESANASATTPTMMKAESNGSDASDKKKVQPEKIEDKNSVVVRKLVKKTKVDGDKPKEDGEVTTPPPSPPPVKKARISAATEEPQRRVDNEKPKSTATAEAKRSANRGSSNGSVDLTPSAQREKEKKKDEKERDRVAARRPIDKPGRKPMNERVKRVEEPEKKKDKEKEKEKRRDVKEKSVRDDGDTYAGPKLPESLLRRDDGGGGKISSHKASKRTAEANGDSSNAKSSRKEEENSRMARILTPEYRHGSSRSYRLK